MPLLQFKGKRVLVAGAGCGIGQALLALLLEGGLEPVLACRTAEQVDALRQQFGHNFESVLCDLALLTAQGGEQLFSQQLAALKGPVEYCVDLMHPDFESLVAGAAAADVASYFNAAVAGRAVFMKVLSRTMLAERFGRIVYLSSAAAGLPAHGQGFYSAAKLASEALYRNLSQELSGRGVSAVWLRAGYVDSGRGRLFIEKEVQKKNRVRTASPDDIARSLIWLLSDAALTICSSGITQDGGISSGK